MLVWVSLIIWILIARILSGNLATSKEKKTFLIMVGLALIFVMGARYTDVFGKGDLNNYARLYTNIRFVEWENIFKDSGMEPGYLILNKLFSMIFPWTQSIVFIEAAICVLFTFRFIYKFCDNVFLAVLLYLAQGPFIFQLTGFRQAIAMSICLFSVEFIHKRKLFSFLLLLALACTFHITAITFVPFYFLAKLKPSFKTATLYIVCYSVISSVIPMLLLFGSDLTGNDYNKAGFVGNFTGPIINLFFCIITIILGWITNKYEDYKSSWKWNMSFIGTFMYMLRFISLPFERIAFYYTSGIQIYLSDLIMKSFKKEESKLIYIMFVCICIVLFFTRIKNTVGPYEFFW